MAQLNRTLLLQYQKCVVACLSEDSKKFKEKKTQKMDKADFSRTKEPWSLLITRCRLNSYICYHVTLFCRRQSPIDVPLTFVASATVVIVVEVEPNSTSTTFADSRRLDYNKRFH